MKKRIISSLLALVLVLTLVPFAVSAADIGNTGANPFEDVQKDSLFYDAVLWAYYAQPQVTNGMDPTHFGPDLTVTRGQCVTFLWRAMGCPEPRSTSNPFVDVSADQYYYKPVLWAVEDGVTNGVDATHFAPDDTLSTAHIITFLYRATGAGSDGWYQAAGVWANNSGLLNGTGMTVAPDVPCPRGDVVLFLYRNKNGQSAHVETIPVTSISLSAYTLNLETGDSQRITASVTPADATGQNITWVSSDSRVATVDSNGVVTACAEGTAVITATCENITAICLVTVFIPNSWNTFETVHYEWDWMIWTWSYDLKMPVAAVNAYKSTPRDPYAILTGYSLYVFEPADDEYLSQLAQVFVDTAMENGWGKDTAVQLAISFVQSLTYTPDDIGLGYDYPKYPLETLYDQGGDCEDTSILLVSLIKEMGYGCCLVMFDDHMGVGILGNDTVEGMYFQMDGGKYFYVETTSEGWSIGDMPPELINKTATIWPF